jgi:hypothetical protein
MSDCPGRRGLRSRDAGFIHPPWLCLKLFPPCSSLHVCYLYQGTYLGAKSIPPTACDSATLFDTILVCAALCRVSRSEAAPTWLPSFWSRTRRCPAPYPTAAPLGRAAGQPRRAKSLCLLPTTCMSTNSCRQALAGHGSLFHVFACLPSAFCQPSSQASSVRFSPPMTGPLINLPRRYFQL